MTQPVIQQNVAVIIPTLVPTAYRSALVAADVVAVPGTVTCTKQAGGSCTAGTYYVKVVAGNAYGRTTAKAGDVTVTTETTNLTVRAAFAAVTGAEYYDIYCSTDADPKWVGRITAAQHALANGCTITAVGTVAAAGSIQYGVDIEAVGTGLQAATTAAVSTAYSIPATVVDCSGHQYVQFDITMSRTGDAIAPALVVTPFLYNSRTATYQAGTPVTVSFGGTAAVYGSLKQRVNVEVRGNEAVGLLIESIAGTGASVDIDAVLS